MKILFVEPHEFPLYSFRKELLDSLIKDGHQILLCISSTPRIEKDYGDKVEKIIDVKQNLKSKNLFTNSRLKAKYKKIIQDEKPDIILSFQIKPNIYCGFAAKDTPMIANITGLGTIFNKNNLLSKVGIFLYKKSFKNVDYVFFQNKDGYQFFVKNKILKNDYLIIPGSGVNTERFAYNDRLPLDKRINFLFASRAIKEKGFCLLLDAIPFVISKNHNVHFNFLCPIEEAFKSKKVKKTIEQYKEYITFLPRTNDMTKIYCDNHFLVSPSYYREGISNVLLESLSCGRPIITTNDNPGCKDVLQEGVNGFGVKSDDLQSLVNALVMASYLDNSEIIKMGKNGRGFVIQNFNRKTVVDTYKSVINKIAL